MVPNILFATALIFSALTAQVAMGQQSDVARTGAPAQGDKLKAGTHIWSNGLCVSVTPAGQNNLPISPFDVAMSNCPHLTDYSANKRAYDRLERDYLVQNQWVMSCKYKTNDVPQYRFDQGKNNWQDRKLNVSFHESGDKKNLFVTAQDLVKSHAWGWGKDDPPKNLSFPSKFELNSENKSDLTFSFGNDEYDFQKQADGSYSGVYADVPVPCDCTLKPAKK